MYLPRKVGTALVLCIDSQKSKPFFFLFFFDDDKKKSSPHRDVRQPLAGMPDTAMCHLDNHIDFKPTSQA